MTSPALADLERLLQEVRTGEISSSEELRELLSPGVYFSISRTLSCVHKDEIGNETIRLVIEGIPHHEVGDPSQFLSYVRELVRSQVERNGSHHCHATRTEAAQPENVERLRRSLRGMPEQHREALKRFYVLGQEEEQILADLQLSPEEFRSLRSRAKARFLGPRVIAE
jgi:hypothetical protein